MRKHEDYMIYQKLTLDGLGLCAFLGLGFEIMILIVLGIRINEVPVFVLGFLWFLSGILVSGFVHVVSFFQNRILEYGKGDFYLQSDVLS